MSERLCEWCGDPLPEQEENQFVNSPYHQRRYHEKCRRLAAAFRTRARCVDCDTLMGPGTGWSGKAVRCSECYEDHRKVKSTARLLGMYMLWERGWKRRQIAERLGTSPASVSASLSGLRAAGVNVTYRRPAQQHTVDPLQAGLRAWREKQGWRS